MSTPADLAYSGNEAPDSLPAAARHAREARIRFWRVFVVSSFFIVILGANLFVGAAVVMGHIRTQVTANNIWAKSQIAQIRRPLLDGTFCRNMTIDNKTAQTIEDKVERCDRVRSKSRAQSKTQFSWGGK